MTSFSVVPSTQGNVEAMPGVTLQRDNWNDFSFLTQYHVFVNVADSKVYLGDVKVLRRGQTSTDSHQLEIGSLSPLGEDFCSLGQSLDYYQRLGELPMELRTEILTHLRDCIFIPTLAVEFADEDGWRISVLRYIDWAAFSRDAGGLLGLGMPSRVEMGMTLRFQVSGWDNPLDLFFHKSWSSRPKSRPTCGCRHAFRCSRDAMAPARARCSLGSRAFCMRRNATERQPN